MRNIIETCVARAMISIRLRSWESKSKSDPTHREGQAILCEETRGSEIGIPRTVGRLVRLARYRRNARASPADDEDHAIQRNNPALSLIADSFAALFTENSNDALTQLGVWVRRVTMRESDKRGGRHISRYIFFSEQEIANGQLRNKVTSRSSK